MKKTVRRDSTGLEDLPNVGRAIAADFRRLGVRTPHDLRGRDPYALYAALERATGTHHDPCVLDTFIAAVRYVEGAPARPWWKYTQARKRTLAAKGVPQKAGRKQAPSRKPSTKPRAAVPNPA